MSQHVVTRDNLEWVFGWDQMLMSFFLQIHDEDLPEEDNPVVWLGTAGTSMYEVEDLVREAKKHGLDIDADLRVRLYRDKDDGV